MSQFVVPQCPMAADILQSYGRASRNYLVFAMEKPRAVTVQSTGSGNSGGERTNSGLSEPSDAHRSAATTPEILWNFGLIAA